jgi:hypothetical protein
MPAFLFFLVLVGLAALGGCFHTETAEETEQRCVFEQPGTCDAKTMAWLSQIYDPK